MNPKLLLFLLLLFPFFPALEARAAGTLIQSPNRVDMVHDRARGLIYISSRETIQGTLQGVVQRYQVATGTFLSPFVLGGTPGGIDLSPDGDTLAVADYTRGENSNWIHLINLATGTSSRVFFPRAFGEGGTFTVAYGNDGSLFVSSNYEGSGWVPLRRYFPQTGITVIVSPAIRQSSMLTPSGDANVIAIAESNSSDGPFGRFRISDGNLLTKKGFDGTFWFNFEIGADRNGSQYAIPTYGGTFTANSDLVKNQTLIGTYAGPQPVGVVYHPVENLVYFPWSTTTQVRVYNSSTLSQVGAYDFEHSFTNTGNAAFGQGRIKISRDGSLLMCSVNGGVRILQIYSPLSATSQSLIVQENTPLAVTVSGTIGNQGVLSYSLLSGPSNGTLTGTLPNVVYTPAERFSGEDSFVFQVNYGRAIATATVSLSVLRANVPPQVSDLRLTVNQNQKVAFAPQAHDEDGDSLTFALVQSPAHGTLAMLGSDWTYAPAPGYLGSDVFTFKANDGQADSNLGTVSINVVAPPDKGPQITASAPLVGPFGTIVVITGLNLNAISQVLFNQNPAMFTVDSPTQITAKVPVGATTGPIQVSGPSGSATGPVFTVIRTK